MSRLKTAALIALYLFHCYAAQNQDSIPESPAQQRDDSQEPFFDLPLIQQARFAQISYCPLDLIEGAVGERLNESTVIYKPLNHIMSFVGKNAEGDIQIVFRGTNGLDATNWATNLDSFLVQYTIMDQKINDAYVHEGFFKAFQSVRWDITDRVNSLINKRKGQRILVTGHSLGGALALLASVDLQLTFPDCDIQLFTFGSPRVGNLAFAIFANNTLKTGYRITHGFDIIPHLPMKIQQYSHTNVELWFPQSPQADNPYVMCLPEFNSEYKSQCADSVIPWLSLKEHRNYMGFDITDTSLCYLSFRIARMFTEP